MNKDVKHHLLILVVLSLMSISSMASDATKSSTKADFKNVYSKYQSALNNEDSETAVTYAEQALTLGKNLYGSDHKTTAVLAFNYAKIFLLNESKIHHSERKPEKASLLLEQAIEIYENAYEENALEFIDPLMSLGTVNLKYLDKAIKGIRYYKKALKIAKANKNAPPLLYADLSFEIGRELIQQNIGGSKSKHYLKTAYNDYHASLQADDIRVVDSAFWLAKYRYFNRDYKDAEKLFLEVIAAYSEAERLGSHRSLTTSAFLVQIYEKMGESEKATEYCQAIGKAKPWSDNREQTPIFLLEPKWPISALKRGKGGLVRMSFTVNKQGFVKEPKVTNLEGNKKFKAAALKAVTSWRFAPKYVNGEAVDAKTAYTMEFVIK